MRRLALILVFFVLYLGVHMTQADRSPTSSSRPERRRSDAFRNFTGVNNPRMIGRLRSLSDNDTDILANASSNPERLKDLSEKGWREIGVGLLAGLIRRKKVDIIKQLLSTPKTRVVLEKFVISKMNQTVTKKLLNALNDNEFKTTLLPAVQKVGLLPGTRREVCLRVIKVYSKSNTNKCPEVTKDTVKEMKGFITCFKKACLRDFAKDKEKLKTALESIPAEKLGNWLDKSLIHTLLGDCATLTKDELQSPIGMLVKLAGDKCVQDIDPKKFCTVARTGGFGGSSGKGIRSKNFGKEELKKIKKGCPSDLKDPDVLRANPSLCKSFKLSNVKHLTLPSNKTEKNELLKQCLCPERVSIRKAKAVIEKIKKFAESNKVSKWDKNLVNSVSNCICGLKLDDFEEMTKEVVRDTRMMLFRAIEHCGKNKRKIGKTIVKKILEAEGLKETDAQAPEKLGVYVIFVNPTIIKALPKDKLPKINGSIIDKIRSKSERRVFVILLFRTKSVIEQGAAAKTLPLKQMKSQTPEDFGLGSNSTEEDAEKLGKVELSRPNCRVLFDKYASKYGQPSKDSDSWPSSDRNKLKRFANGMPKETIEKLSSDQIEDFIEKVSGEKGIQMPSQCKSFVKKIKENENLKKPSDFKASSMEKFGNCVEFLEEDELQNLPEKSEMCSYLGKKKGFESAGKKKNMAKFCLSSLTEGKGAKSLISDHLSILGNLLAFFEDKDLAEIPDDAIDGALSDVQEAFCGHVFKDERKDKREAQKWNDEIRKKLKNVAAKIKDKANNLDLAGCLVGGFEEKDIESATKENLQDVADEIKKCKNKDLQKAVNKKLREPEKTTRRKRRDLSSATADDIALQSFGSLDADDITTMSCNAFNPNIEEIGNTAGFSESQLKAWVQLVKKCWNQDVKLFTADQLQNLGTLAPGFTADELGMMDLSEDESIEALGDESYSDEQLKKAWQQVKTKKGKEAKDFGEAELISLGNFAKAMTAEEIGQIGPFEEVVESLGNITGWSEEQLDQLKKTASKYYGADASKWEVAQINNVGTVVGGFSKDELKNLNEEQLQVITAAGIAQISPEKLDALSLDQLNSMNPDQKAAITSAQKDGLSLVKRNALNKDAGSEPENDAASSVVYSMVVLLVPFANAFNFAN